MPLVSLVRRLGNKAYEHAFPIYRLSYQAFKAYTDRVERRLLKKVVSTGAVVVDVGANIGIYSQFLSKCVGPTGVVHAFEPSPENFKRLQSVTQKLGNIYVRQAAVGERTGTTRLYIADNLNVDHRTYVTEGDLRRTLEVNVVALDDYFQPHQRVDLIKIDIQGFEVYALRGANRVLAENPAVRLLLEFWPHGLKQAGASWMELIAMLQSKNMGIWQLSQRGLLPFRPKAVREDPRWYVNLFAHSK